MNGSTSFWDLLLWSFWIFIWISAIIIWFRCVFDLFTDHTLSGWGKAGWAALLIFLPWLGAFIYIVARGRSMAQRQVDAAVSAVAQQEKYIRSVASSSISPTEQIMHAKSLLDAGAISQDEFASLKAKALA
ncbi:MAG TPA: SHOCT domain-containing protein [Dermatophilaceae bacterium]|jgi:hypothetical protein|uniref:SHOCT domain-containing protein n=1 Tax=Candidatus Phosphoribacter hodrii TaxID=2953743 RepID=A0A934X6P9_9MICO|nr:SHOCT domain-containing protein [Candidatus Phosphoribacter hodrii]OPZ55555.1 MAG: hypothetical protein BWY91_00950 [bacterium ADurb.BinA028]HNV14724.1 SHOCT domain-containing protein [Dermatophilaceae bacterium]MBL0003410.1 SHOCT domain-containing protein [Candidatus Phosphoribacter hodrii]HOA01737.1 SHOCT domain-containing protein [Dermatophilaceae bacterium]